MQEKIKELETHIGLLVSEISLLKSEMKSKSSVEYAETLANEAKELAVTALEEANNSLEALKDKADQSQVTDLANSWALTLKSGDDIKVQINASTDGVRLASNFIHLTGDTLIDSVTIKSAHIDTLNANKVTGNTADFEEGK